MCIEHVCVNTHISVYVAENLAEIWVNVSFVFIHGWGNANGIRFSVVFIRG